MSAPHPRVIFHVDMDAFYASIEQRDNSEYRGKPVIVGSMPGTRGVVSAASYEARKFGVHSALPISQAYKKCPQGIYVRPRMGEYVLVSKQIMEIFEKYTPAVEPLSIDEAFMDMTGTEKLWGRPLDTARSIKKDVLEATELTCSIGIAPNKYLAKLASDINKPDGITPVPFAPEDCQRWLAPLPVKKVWGIGKRSGERLTNMGINTIGDLQQMDKAKLEKTFGKHGGAFYALSRGEDYREVETEHRAKSISREHTFGEDSSDRAGWEKLLLSLSRDVGERSRKASLKGSTVVFTYRKSDFQRHSKQCSLDAPTDSSRVIYDKVIELLDTCGLGKKKLRLIGVGLTGFDRDSNKSKPAQMSLLEELEELENNLPTREAGREEWEKSEAAMDAISRKFGRGSIFFGGEI